MNIPRIFHFIWISGPVPMRLRQFRTDWELLHPGWEFRDWGDRIPWPYPPAPPSCCCARQFSNWMRLQVLRAEGGVYVDFDIEPLQNIEPLLGQHEAVATLMPDGRMTNNFLACTPGHPWIVDCCRRLLEVDPAVHLSMGSPLVAAAAERHPVARPPIGAILQEPGARTPAGCYAIHHFDNMRRRDATGRR